MTLEDPGPLTLEEARDHVARSSFRFDSSSSVGRVGLEPEFFPIVLGPERAPAGRVPLSGEGGGLSFVETLARRGDFVLPREDASVLRYLLVNGGNVTFEPGGQIEHSTTAHESAGAALADVEDFLGRLVPVAREAGVVLAALGTDVWHGVESVPLQLDHWRYRSMQASFDRRGVHGRVMMRHTATTQVNLDLGDESVAGERYLLANLVSPLVTASFACSPTRGAAAGLGEEGVCARALAWQGLDPTRTGFPPALVSGEDSFSSAWADAVLGADVMLFRTASGAETGSGGFSFARWIQEGHPAHGRPSRADLDYHMTTVFFEVRARGFLELRAADGLPSRWRPAPVVFLATLLYDAETRRRALELLEPRRAALEEDWRTAARVGLRDDVLAKRAQSVWELVLAGAERLPRGWLRDADLASTREFVARFVAQGRMPVDELLEALGESPAAALAWATEEPR